MISKLSKVASASATCIASLSSYLAHGHKDELKTQQERITDCFTLNMYADAFVDDLDTATEEMMFYASLNTRSEKSKYMHLVLSLSENETLDQATWKNIVADYLEAVGMKNHQCIAVQHKDNGKEHYHLIINRIDTKTRTRVNDYKMFYKLQRFDEQIEEKYNLQRYDHKVYNRDNPQVLENKAERKARDIESKSEHESFIFYLLNYKQEIINSRSWSELFSNLNKLNCTIAVKGRGLVIKSLSDQKVEVKASTFDRSFSYKKLMDKYGFYDFTKPPKPEPELPKTEYKAEPITKNAKRIEYSKFFLQLILERHDKVIDKGDRFVVSKAKSYKTYQDLLKIAKRRFGDGKIVATGSYDFQKRLMYHAIKMNIKVKFSDAKVQREYEQRLATLNHQQKTEFVKRQRNIIKRDQELKNDRQNIRARDQQRVRSQESTRTQQTTQSRSFHR